MMSSERNVINRSILKYPSAMTDIDVWERRLVLSSTVDEFMPTSSSIEIVYSRQNSEEIMKDDDKLLSY